MEKLIKELIQLLYEHHAGNSYIEHARDVGIVRLIESDLKQKEDLIKRQAKAIADLQERITELTGDKVN